MPNDVLTRAIDAVASGDHLTADHAAAVLAEIMEGRAGEVQTGAFLIALRAKGETVPELVGLARTMRSLASPVETGRVDLVDTAGTGGGPSTFNVSTAAALVAAAAGCAVAKHGNRSSTSRSGSADLLEALGVNIELDPAAVGACIDEVGFGFMFAPRHHAAMAHVIPVRKELAVRTIFNFLGPLTNPAGAARQLLGVSDRHYQETIAEALVGLGSERAMVVSAEDGLDELSISARTRVIEVASGATTEAFVEPGQYVRRGRAGGGRRRHPRGERRRDPRRLRRRARAPARPRPPQRRRRDLRRRRRPESLGAGVERAAETIDCGEAGILLDAADRSDRRHRPSRLRTSSGNDRAAHRGGPRGSRRVAAARYRRPISRRSSASAETDRPFNEALVTARASR